MKKPDALLEHLEQENRPESTGSGSSGSSIQIQLLTILENPDKHPVSLDKINNELLASFSQLQIQKAIITLLEKGIIETVYTPKIGLSLIIAPT